ncbi:hypothetical protein ABT112_09090 [Streptomyces sp. NPDC002055]|uniref:hypothetical protein n=1 Tax=Streptomyces sp. NPDC002055 TaxID=3154534 RepID=UPI003318E27C
MSQGKLSAAERLAARMRGVEPHGVEPQGLVSAWPRGTERNGPRAAAGIVPMALWDSRRYRGNDDGPPSAA